MSDTEGYWEVWVFGKLCRYWFRTWYGKEETEADWAKKEALAEGYCTVKKFVTY